MTSSGRRILLIDDDKLVHKVVRKTIGEGPELISYTSAREALSFVAGHKKAFDVIILDVEMPEMSGYEVCQAIRRIDACRQTPIIFLSSHSSVSERIAGYEAGGDDYLVKPVDIDILNAKLQRWSEHLKHTEALLSEAAFANKTATDAISTSSDLGQAMRFIEKSYECHSPDALCRAFFSVSTQQGLNCTLMYNSSNARPEYVSCKGVSSPLEQELISMLRTGERFRDFGARTQINYQNASVLIKNMPVDDSDRYGRSKDLLNFMLGAFNAKIASINTHERIRLQSVNLGKSIIAFEDTLEGITAALRENQDQITNILGELLTDFEENLPKMGLEDDQESYLISRVDDVAIEANTSLDKSAELLRSLNSVVRLFEHSLEQQNRLVDDLLNSTGPGQNEADEEDVELF